jgi:hypothetical protein
MVHGLLSLTSIGPLPGTHAPVASQTSPPVSQMLAAEHLAPAGRGEQVPTLPGIMHDEQTSVHAVLQQTPWGEQKPLPHCELF